jgi:hypothetical protein
MPPNGPKGALFMPLLAGAGNRATSLERDIREGFLRWRMAVAIVRRGCHCGKRGGEGENIDSN